MRSPAKTSRAAIGSLKSSRSPRPAFSETWPISASVSSQSRRPAAITSAPADTFGLVDRGRIAAGLRADLVLVDGDPTTDILATRAIRAVWKNGVPVERPLP